MTGIPEVPEDGTRLRIATWNVERPKPRGWKVPPAQLRRMAEVEADVWVLTETHLDHQPSDEHRHSVVLPAASRASPGTRTLDRYLVPVADHPSRRPATAPARHGHRPDRDAARAAARLRHGDCLGQRTASRRRSPGAHVGGPSRRRSNGRWGSGLSFAAASPMCPSLWPATSIRTATAARWYGTRAARDLVTEGLSAAGMTCVTEMDVVAGGLLQGHHLVDHLAFRQTSPSRSRSNANRSTGLVNGSPTTPPSPST